MSLLLVMITIMLALRKLRPGPLEGSERLRRRVREVCTAFNVSSRVTSLQLRHIYVDDTRRILYCSAQKVASTAWKKVWLRLTSPPQTKTVSSTNRHDIHLRSQQNMLIQPKFEDVWQDMLASYRKFLFVRHPFERVVSAYRDKIQFVKDMEDSEIPQSIRKKISQNLGASASRAAAEEVVGFPEFVKFIVEQDDEDIIPWDSHWRSVHQLCNPCGIEYDFIGKFENLPDDADYVLRWLGVEDLVGNFPATQKSKAEADVAFQYLKELSSSIKMSFLAKYRLDFLSFHYEFD
ncbi:carbohydrate sulfotransferase 11-like [Panulirus ornatus]|uniref:carbohydrate sulfotransferase 11-like n=1 Tax=Panulirus ornatus TaxID=150431 RepID=UPI003A84E7CF